MVPQTGSMADAPTAHSYVRRLAAVLADRHNVTIRVEDDGRYRTGRCRFWWFISDASDVHNGVPGEIFAAVAAENGIEQGQAFGDGDGARDDEIKLAVRTNPRH
jgi:hypothetical protein